MTGFLPDSNVLVALISEDHEHHARADAEVNRRLARGEDLLLATHALAEAYSTLTSLPRPARLTPQAAWSALNDDFIGNGRLSALTEEEYLDVLGRCASEAVVGGTVYDALIAACAEKAQADTLLTFNERHFRRFASPSLQIVVPAS